ncbi:MAG TPA: TraR/DksA C4-type zinc finger protein [Streptosporangiaceae bacterium]
MSEAGKTTRQPARLPAREAQAAQARLDAEHAAALARLAALQADFDAVVRSAEGAADDEHDPDGTTAYERQHVAAQIDQAREQLEAVQAALGRLQQGSYGVCERCGQLIAAERLAARPTAASCVSCAGRR